MRRRAVRPGLVTLALLLWACALGAAGCQPPSDAASTSGRGAPDTTAAPALPDSALTPPDAETGRRFRAAMRYAAAHRDSVRSIGRLMQVLGTRFMDAPYAEGTLDEPPTETLVVHLDKFDCVTYVETVLAMARGAWAGDTTYAGFARRLAEQRYRGGTMRGYCSRLHYFTEWLTDNERRGLVDRLDDTLGGRALPDTLDFMSTHRSAYDRFATNDSLYACIRATEDSIRARRRRRSVRYVPQDSIRAVYDQLRAGDLVAVATSVEGLDISHTGLVYAHEDGSRGLLHASLDAGVTVSPDLQRYVQTIDHHIGIVVARPRPAP